MAEEKKAAKKVQNAEVKEVESTKSSAKVSSKNPVAIALPVILGIIVIAVVILLITKIGGGSLGGDEGIDIPEDFEELEADDYKLGYPEGWENLGTGDSVQIYSNEGNLLGGEFTGFFLEKSSSDNIEEDDVNKIQDGKCEEVKELAEDTAESDEVEFKEAESVKLNGEKGCKFVLEGKIESFLSESTNLKATIYIVAKDKDNAYVLMAISTAEGDSEYEKAIDVARTFDLND